MVNALKANAMARFFLLFVVIVLICFLAFYLIFSESREADLGIVAPSYKYNRFYESEPGSFYLESFHFNFPRGATIIPVTLNDTFTGYVLVGDGKVFNREKQSYDTISGGYLVLDEETFLRLKDDTLFLPLENHLQNSRQFVNLRDLIKSPSLYALGYERIFLPPAGGSHIYLEYNGVQVQQPSLEKSHGHFLTRLIVYFSLVIAIVLLAIQALTLDLKPSYNLAVFLQTRPVFTEYLTGLFILLTLFLAHLSWSTALPANPFRGESIPRFFFLYMGLFLLVHGLAYKGKIPAQYLGFGWRQVPRELALALVVALIITVFSTLRMPSGLVPFAGNRQLVSQFLHLFSWAAAFELMWRGFFQTFLERLCGAKAGLLAGVVLFTGFFFLLASLNDPRLIDDTLLLHELLFFVPGTTLILGYTYQKTRSIVGSSLILTLLFLLPRLLTF